MDLFPLYNSLRISLISSVLTLFFGVFFAWWVTKLPSWWKSILDAFFTVPMVLPPTVVGFLLLVMISPKSVLGQLVHKFFESNLTMTWYASILAVVVVSFPILYRTVRSSFEHLDQNIIYAAQTLGIKNSTIFYKIILPQCKSGIVAGFILSFARGLGEYGATSMVSGYIPQKTATISTTVAFYWQTGQEKEAVFWVIFNLCISFIVMCLVNYFEKRQK
ncbi:MAG: molybdate ABC transporter permease subunit [Eubacteriales bacterium]